MPKFQVISNLLGNAVKYSPDGGEVLITTSHGDGEVRISVKDHGVGIAPEDLPRLFQRYERINSKSGHKISGTGLGLVIARQIVEMHGGRIWAGRNEEGGSEFAFTIPQGSRTAPSPDAKPLSRQSCLIRFGQHTLRIEDRDAEGTINVASDERFIRSLDRLGLVSLDPGLGNRSGLKDAASPTGRQLHPPPVGSRQLQSRRRHPR